MSIPVERCIVSRDLTEPRLSPDGRCDRVRDGVGGRRGADDRHRSTARRFVSSPPIRRRDPGEGSAVDVGAGAPTGRRVIYAAVDGDLWLQPVPTAAVRRLTEHGPERTAAAPATLSGREPCRLRRRRGRGVGDSTRRRRDRNGSTTAPPTSCFDPCPTPGRQRCVVAGVERARHAVGRVANPAVTFDRRAVSTSARPPASIQQIRFMPDGTMVCLRDDTGWLNLWLGDGPLVDEPFEHGGPTWGHGPAVVRRLSRRWPSRVHPQRARLRPAVCRRRRQPARSAKLLAACTVSCRGRAAGWPRCDRVRAHRRRWSSTTTPPGSATSSRSGR